VSTQEPPQFSMPLLQSVVHCLVEQTMPTGQLVLHEPQRPGSELRSTHAPLQASSGALHVKPHIPCAQVGVPPATSGHDLPQAPQFFGSLSVSTQTVPHAT
jgi:hypothetical protein